MVGCGSVENKKVSKEKEKVSMENGKDIIGNYMKIKIGMSFDEVKKIVGKPSRTLQEVKCGDVSAGTYIWDTNDRRMELVIGIENGYVKFKDMKPGRAMQQR